MTCYTVKVKKSRTKTYLWGSGKINIRLNSSLYFTLRVVDMGEAIVVGLYKSQTATGAAEEIEIGILDENEAFTIQLQDISGVYAYCKDISVDTKVECFIEGFTNG